MVKCHLMLQVQTYLIVCVFFYAIRSNIVFFCFLLKKLNFVHIYTFYSTDTNLYINYAYVMQSVKNKVIMQRILSTKGITIL